MMSHMSNDLSIWTALADSKRRQIINLLEERPRTTNEISEFFDVSRFAVMKHLNILEQANLIEVRREGRKRWNILNDDLAHFLRTKLANNDADSPYRLVEILGLFPGQKPAAPIISPPVETIHIEQSVLLQAAPQQVFAALTVGIDAWWNPRVSTDSRINLEPYVNGRFYEAFNPAGQGVLYATVTFIKQDEELRLQGTVELTEQFANMQAIDNVVRIILEPVDDATRFTLSHRIANSGGVDGITHDICKHRWGILLNQYLKPFVEKDVPALKEIH